MLKYNKNEGDYMIFITFLIIGIILFLLYKKKQDRIKKEQHIKEMRQKRIKERIDLYTETFNSIKIISPNISKDATQRRYLKDIPSDFNISSIRKNTSKKRLNDFVVIDTETTGLKPSQDEILEISAIKFINGEPKECLTTLIKPNKGISKEAERINHISEDMVKDAPKIEYVISDFSNFIKGYNIVGYNVLFDIKFLYVNGMDFFILKRYFYDALDLTKKVYKDELYNFKLDTVAEKMELYRPNAHRSSDDAFITGIIFRDLGNFIREGNINTRYLF